MTTSNHEGGSLPPEPGYDPDIWSEEVPEVPAVRRPPRPARQRPPSGEPAPPPRARPRRRPPAPDGAPQERRAPQDGRPPQQRPPQQRRPQQRPPQQPEQPPVPPPVQEAQPPQPPQEARPRRARRVEEDEYFDLPSESRVPRWIAALLVVALVIAVVGGGAVWWYRHQVDPSGPPGKEVAITIPEGATTSKVGSILDDEGVISSATLFGFYVGGKDLSTVQAGSYTFRLNSSFDEAIATLNAGPDKPLSAAVTKFNIPEGYTVPQIVARISEKVPRLTAEDLNAALDQGLVPTSLKPEGTTSYEGLLFPATYEVTSDDTAVDVLTKMAHEMESRAQTMGIDEAAAAINQKWGLQLTPYDLLTTASLIQEEAGSAEEAPKIATVIYNRLREGWPLGIDATSKYLAGVEGGDIDFDSPSPYNTRKQTGLPPTPIAAPGEYALDGAFNPAEGDWMYYVLTDPGVHTFAVTDAEFGAARQICIQKDLGCG